MKHLLLLLLLAPTLCTGQLPFNTQVNNWRTYNNSTVTTASAYHSITPVKVGGGIGDSLGKYIVALKDTLDAVLLSGCTCDLQAVLNNGNNAEEGGGNTGAFNFTNSSDNSQMHLSSYGLFLYKPSTGSVCAQFHDNSGQGVIDLFDLTTHSFTLKTTALTANRIALLPDEGNGTGVPSTLVTHTTKDNIVVQSGGNICIMDNAAGISASVSGGNYVKMSASTSSGVNGLQIYYGLGVGRILGDILTSNESLQIPDESGSSAATPSTIVTHTTKNTITVNDGSTGSVDVNNTGVNAKDASGNLRSGIGVAAGDGYLSVSNTGSHAGIIKADSLTTSRFAQLPEIGRSYTFGIRGDGVAPTFSAGTGAGTSPTITILGGSDDVAGKIQVLTGAAPAGNAKIASIIYNTPYPAGTIAKVTITPGSLSATVAGTQIWVTNESNTGFEIWSSVGGLNTITTYVFNYQTQL